MQSEQPSQITQKEVASVDLDTIPQPQLTGHAWKQQGTMLICESCTFNHSSYIPPDYQLYGIDEKGYPKFRKIDVKS